MTASARSRLHTVTPLLAVAVLPLIVVFAFALRIGFAPMQGLDFDIGTNQGWAKSAVELGLARSYREQVGGTMLPNYPPFSMMIFSATGHIYKLLVSPEYDTGLPAYRLMIKLPAILADLALCMLLGWIVAKLRGRNAGWLAAGIVALHPAIVYESAVWGQTDSIFTLFLVASIAALAWERTALAAALFTLAFLTKAQTAALLPLFGVWYLIRPQRMLWGLAGSAIVLFVVLLPFALGGAIPDIWHVYTGSVGYYPVISSAAYNFWWSLLADSSWSRHDTELLFGLITFRAAGYLLFTLATGSALVMLVNRMRQPLMHRQALPILFLLGALCSFAFFLLLTEMHERYLFPFVALALPVAFMGRKEAWIYTLVSALFFMNLLGYLPIGFIDRGFYGAFSALDVFFASMQVFLFAHLLGVVWSYRIVPGKKGWGWRGWVRKM